MPPVNEEVLLSLMMHAPMGICIMDAVTQVSEVVNDAFLEVAGRSREQVVGHYYWDTFAEVRHLFENDLDRASRGETIRGDELEIPLIRYGKEEMIMINFVYMPLKDQNGTVNKVAVWVIENTKEVRERQAVSASEERFRALVTATSDVVYSLSADWEVMRPLDGRGFLRDTYQPITSWRKQNVHPDDMERVNTAIAEAIRDKKIFQMEHKVLRADGSPGWTFSRAVPILDIDGQIVEWFGMASDTTGLKEAIARRKEEERQLQLMINMLPASVVVIRGDELTVEMINQANLDYWKKTAVEVIGKPFLEILPDLADQPFAGQLHHVMASGEVLDVKESPVLFENPDGSIRETYVDYTYQPLYDGRGSRNGVLVMSFEITDRVLARRQVEQSEENLRAMIAQAPVAMCILTGPEHIITVANQLMVELWGKPQGDVMNKPVFEALPDARGQGLEEVMKKVYETGETFYASEAPVSLIRHGKPEVVYQNFVYQAYRDSNGAITGVFAITIDVTEQVLARKTIEETQNQLKAELAKKDAFIGMASHELKTPLTSLSALLQMATQKLKNSQDTYLPGAIEKSNIQVKRMTAMVNGFLNISRLEAGMIHIEKQAFDLDKLIGEVLEETKLTVTSHQINYNGCGPVQTNADRDKISSVLSNLVSNAVKYSPKGKLIEVDCKAQTDEVIVRVSDEGMGVKPQDIANIFDRYYRVKSKHTQQIAGFGIGLYLSAEIIRRHDGRIWVESKSGKGSAFYFSLPLS